MNNTEARQAMIGLAAELLRVLGTTSYLVSRFSVTIDNDSDTLEVRLSKHRGQHIFHAISALECHQAILPINELARVIAARLIDGLERLP